MNFRSLGLVKVAARLNTPVARSQAPPPVRAAGSASCQPGNFCRPPGITVPVEAAACAFKCLKWRQKNDGTGIAAGLLM
jgi:hypothetical protein